MKIKLSKYELRKKVEKLLSKVSELEKSNEILRNNLMEKDKNATYLLEQFDKL